MTIQARVVKGSIDGVTVYHAALKVEKQPRLYVSTVVLTREEHAKEYAENWRKESFYCGYITAA